MTPRLLSFAVIIIELFSVLQFVETQSSTAQCGAQFSWMTNSRGQNPCLVAAYMQGVCTGGAFTVAPLPPDTHYTGPTAQQANNCQCSTVTYSLVSACGVCQARTIETWSTWSFNCTSPYLQVFPGNIPSGTAVPAWAYLDVVQTDVFDPDTALADIGAPESSASATKPTGIISSSSSAYSPVYTSSTTPSQSSGKKKTNVGAIAGGAAGGVVFLALVAGLIAFLLVRRRRPTKRVPSTIDGYSNAALNSPPPMSQQSTYGTPSYTGHPPHPESQTYNDNPAYAEPTAFRVYDPSDPSTYPTKSLQTPTIRTTNSGPAKFAPMPHPYGPQARASQYNGFPEL